MWAARPDTHSTRMSLMPKPATSCRVLRTAPSSGHRSGRMVSVALSQDRELVARAPQVLPVGPKNLGKVCTQFGIKLLPSSRAGLPPTLPLSSILSAICDNVSPDRAVAA